MPYVARHRLTVAHRLHRETDRRGPRRAFDLALVARLDLSLYHAGIAVLKGALAATMQRAVLISLWLYAYSQGILIGT